MTATYEDILYEVKDGVATITINRPQVLNAFRVKTVNELISAFRLADNDRRVDPAERSARLHDAAHDGDAGLGHADRIAALEGTGRKADPFFGGEALGKGGGALVRGKHDPPTPGDQRLS